MTKRALVAAGDGAALERVPSGTALVLDFSERAFDASLLGRCADLRLPVHRVLARAGSLADPRLDAFLEARTEVLVVLDGPVSIRDALEGGRRLARPSLQVEVRLESDTDLDVLKILSSLGVRTRIAVSRLAGDGELAVDALTDAWLSGVRRAPVTPFAELERHLHADDFELAQLDYRENDHYVELRSPRDAGAIDWESPRVAGKRIPFLLELHPCATCEGLCFCHGYLLDQGRPEQCRAFFSEAFLTLALAEANRAARQANRPAPTGARAELGSRREPRPAPVARPQPSAPRRALPLAPDAPLRSPSGGPGARRRPPKEGPC